MGRWTPLILMAGGLAILLGTLVGISFPMGGQNSAQAPTPRNRTSRVLPANINVNSAASGNAPASSNGTSVAQNNTVDDSATQESVQENTQDANVDDTQSVEGSQPSEPIRALW